jgi:hypothetical protein
MNNKNLICILCAFVAIAVAVAVYRFREEGFDLSGEEGFDLSGEEGFDLSGEEGFHTPAAKVSEVKVAKCAMEPKTYLTDPMYTSGYRTRGDYCESFDDPYWKYWCTAARYV